ncbi:NADP-dependent isocitrate dehydrogenase [Hyphobacterium sp. HN65]|uniref:Isocitrate dehydrogenase [NADP] n=1 Tax=Hyphobacterium lacteum TaxID=3116575 RepID=A0ABU7LLI2_9PROT|nr:NADP-dependent isocitrate dehydrogenase [Hyphobacterium sp. HN65]MEE2524742.1 NADP-dependent isocitrate dehydrogenase [Hyphobacterium sp. HN65]
MNAPTKTQDFPQFAEKAETPRVTVAFGDGIGPEIMQAALDVLIAGGAQMEIEPIDIGEKVYKSGISAGITPAAWDSLRRTRVFYKAPITTPQGGGYKSLNVTVRKSLGLFANVRPCTAYAPYIATRHPDMDVVIVRENEEDLYAGIEHRQTDEVYQCLKLITRPGCEKIVRYAFEYARAYGRQKVTCMVKDNIMKLTDGLFRKVFDEIASEYPEIEADHYIIDIGTARLADQPERFDVIVTPNLYGDIISDVAAEIAGSVGMGASANIGESCAMFEAIHGSAPDIAGQNIANPSGLILAGVMMLVHLGQGEAAARIHNAWLKTVEDGVGTGDMKPETETLGTKEFARAVIARLGQKPSKLPEASYEADQKPIIIETPERAAPASKALVGVDIFVHDCESADDLADRLNAAAEGPFKLVLITNRGVKVWPQGLPETFCTDHWRCRFEADGEVSTTHVASLMAQLAGAAIDVVKTENLYTFDGERGYSLGQGQ